jgi:hypothetical protein
MWVRVRGKEKLANNLSGGKNRIEEVAISAAIFLLTTSSS